MKKAVTFLLLLVSCSSSSQHYIPPRIPDNLVNDRERLEYLVVHYWDNYDFRDPYIFVEDNTMLDYFVLLKDVSCDISSESIFRILNNASRNNQIFSLFIDTYRVYLFNPESFFCDYEKYLAVDEYVLGNHRISQNKKREFELERTLIYTNRVGDKATNFAVVDKNNNLVALNDIESEYLIVLFHNPDCGVCVETMEKLSKSEVVGRMIDAGRLKVLTVCPYEEYDLWKATEYPDKWLNGYDIDGRINWEHLYYFLESSSLYLLDKDKRILKKDIRMDLLEEYLSDLMD